MVIGARVEYTQVRYRSVLVQKERIELLPVFDGSELAGVIDQENLREFILVRSALSEG